MDVLETIENFYSVSEITGEIKEILETAIPTLWIKGEISNFVHHNSGHFYFTLKDENAQISCVMWRSRNSSLTFYPENGATVLVRASVRVYEKRGNYQLDCIKMLPAGVGALQLAFEELKKKLHAEGLFKESHKKNIPAIPEKIAIVTSQTGAAVRDILNVLARRFPACKVLLRPTLVQGKGAASDIAQAIYKLNHKKDIDVMIVGRGGGSLEDLWAFNEEIVARAVYESEIPIISAVGHEIDYTICDFVADLRAPTPSAAAELVVPDQQEILTNINFLLNKSARAASNKIKQLETDLHRLEKSYALRRVNDTIRQNQQYIDGIWSTIHHATRHSVEMKGLHFQNVLDKCNSMHPAQTLKRGFCIVRKNGKIVKSTEKLEIDDTIETQFADGAVNSRIIAKSI